MSVWPMTVLSGNIIYSFFPTALKRCGKSQKANNHTPELAKMVFGKEHTELNPFTSSYQ